MTQARAFKPNNGDIISIVHKAIKGKIKVGNYLYIVPNDANLYTNVKAIHKTQPIQFGQIIECVSVWQNIKLKYNSYRIIFSKFKSCIIAVASMFDRRCKIIIIKEE
jgi:hypothetical protein